MFVKTVYHLYQLTLRRMVSGADKSGNDTFIQCTIQFIIYV